MQPQISRSGVSRSASPLAPFPTMELRPDAAAAAGVFVDSCMPRDVASEEGPGSVPPSVSVTEAPQIFFGESESGEMTGGEVGGSCQGTGGGGGGGGSSSSSGAEREREGQDSEQYSRDGLANQRGNACATSTLLSPPQRLLTSPRDDFQNTPATAPLPTSCSALTREQAEARGAPKRKSPMPVRDGRSRRARGGSVKGVTWSSLGTDTVRQDLRRRISKSAEPIADFSPPYISSTAATTTLGSMMPVHAARSAPSTCHFRNSSATAALEAFSLSFQNCIHKQEIVFERLDAVVARLESECVSIVNSGDSAGDGGGASLHSLSCRTQMSMISAVSAPNSAPLCSDLRQHALLTHDHHCVPTADATGEVPNQPGLAMEFPGIAGKGRSSDGVPGMADDDSSRLDGGPSRIKSCVSPVLSPSSSSLKDVSLADEYDHTREHHTHQSSRSSTPVSVVVMRPALERISVCSGGAPTLRSSSQQGLSPLPNILPLALASCVRLEGAAAAQFSVTPVTLSHLPQNVLSSSATVSPPSPTSLVRTRMRSVTSSDDSRCRTSPTKTLFSLGSFTSLAVAHTSLPSSSCEEARSRQRCSEAAAEAEAVGDDGDTVTQGAELSSSARARGAGGHESCSAAALTTGGGGSASSVLDAAPMSLPSPAATPSTDAAAAQQSLSSCCGTGGDGVPTWSQVSSRQASSGFVRFCATADCALSRDVTTQSVESVSLSPLSRPPSTWGGYSMPRGIIPCSLSPLQMPLTLQSYTSLGRGAVGTAGMSPRRPPNNPNSGNTSSVAAAVAPGGAQPTPHRSPRAGATLEHLRQASTTPASTGSLLSPNPPQLLYCSPRDQVSTFSGTWISSSSSSTPRLGHQESGVVRYGSSHRVSIESRDSAQQILSSTNTNVTLCRLAAMTTEGSVVSSLSTTSPLLPMLPASSRGEAAQGCSTEVLCRTQAGSASPAANRALVFSPSQSAEGVVLSPSIHESVRSSPSPSPSGDDPEDEDAHQLLRLGNRYSPPPPPPSLTELQQAQNQLRRWSAPPVPTMRRPPMAPVRGTNATMVSSSWNGEVERPRSVTPPAARPEQWLLFEEQHERLHLPECWRDSEVVVVDHERNDRDYDAQEAARRQLLESHDVPWTSSLNGLDDDDDDDDGGGVLRRGRVRGSGYRNSTLGVTSTTGADSADEMRDGERLHWSSGSGDECAQDTSIHLVQPVTPPHPRGVSQASPRYIDTEDRLRNRSPYAHMHSRGRRSVSGERGGIRPDSTAPTRAEPSAADTTSIAVADGPASFSEPLQRSSSGRRSALASLSGADNGVVWTDLLARFDELLRIQRRSRGFEQCEADGCIPGEQTLPRLSNTAASTLAREDIAGGFPRRRQSRSHSFSHGVTSCLRGAEGEWGQGASHRSGGDPNGGYDYDVLHPREESDSFPSRSTHTLSPFPMPLERTHTHPSTGHYGESQWKGRMPVDVVPDSPLSRGEDEDILSPSAFSLSVAATSSPREHGDAPSQASRTQVPTLCKQPPAFLTSPRRPSVTVNAAHTTGRNSSVRSRKNTSRYDSDEEDDGVEERCVMVTGTHAVSARPRTPRLRFPQSSRAASSIVKLGRKRRCVVALHRSAAKEHRGFHASQREGDTGETTSSATDCADGLLSAVQSLQAAVVTSSHAVTPTAVKKGKRTTPGSSGRGFAHASSRVSSGGRAAHLSPTNSVSRDSSTTALAVPAIETEGGRAADGKESRCDITSTCPPMTARMSALHPSDHALDGGELAEPYSPALMAATAAASTPPPPPPPPMPKGAQDSGTQRGRLRDRKVNSSRGHGKEHDGRFVLFVSPSRHRHPRSSGAEGEGTVSSRPLIKASARHAPGPLEGEGKHQDGGVAPGATAADSIDSRAFLRRLAQHKSRTRAMEQRMGSISTSVAQAHPSSVAHIDNGGSGGAMVLNSGIAAGKQGAEPGSGAGVEVARQDALLPSRVCAAPAVVGGASSDAFPTCGAAAWSCGGIAADAVHVTVIDPVEASGVYALHAAPSGFSFGIAATGQHLSPKPRRRRIDLRTRLTHKMSVFTTTTTTAASGPASRSKISTAAFAATTDATPPGGSAASAHIFRRAESGYIRLHADSPLIGSHTHHVICGDRRRPAIGSDAQPSATTSVLDRLPRPTRNPQASQLVG